MDSSLPALAEFYAGRRARQEPLALATIIATEGSTYRKPGGRMLISASGDSAGLLSGGCVEADLLAHAQAVLAAHSARIVDYDQRTSMDPLWGLGMGCEGAMRVLLQPLSAANGYQPFASFTAVLETLRPLTYATVIRSRHADWPLGRTWVAGDAPADDVGATLLAECASATSCGIERVRTIGGHELAFFVDRIVPPPKLLLLGAGPDAVPVADQATRLGWSVTVIDHRPAYALAERFPRTHVLLARPDELQRVADPGSFDAAVVMSHHLDSDREYLRWLSRSTIPYVGLLGPAARRERLRSELAAEAARLDGRLFGPVGLDIGATTPEGIALAIVSEIHAVLARRAGGSYSATAQKNPIDHRRRHVPQK